MEMFFRKSKTIYVLCPKELLEAYLASKKELLQQMQYEVTSKNEFLQFEYVQTSVLTMNPPSAIAMVKLDPVTGGCKTKVQMDFCLNDSGDMVLTLAFGFSLLWCIGTIVFFYNETIPLEQMLTPVWVLLCAILILSQVFSISASAFVKFFTKMVSDLASVEQIDR